MIETTNPEINVAELMERVRREAAKIATRETLRPQETGRRRVRAPVLPAVADVAVPPVAGFSKALDVKHQRTEETLRRARRAIEVPGWVPKLFRGWFRSQGGYNQTVLDTVGHLAKTNHQLNRRVQELVAVSHQQNHWLRTLAGHQQTQASWSRGASPILSEFGATQQSLADLQTDVQRLDTTSRELQEADSRAGEHLRNLQGQTDSYVAQLTTTSEQLSATRDLLATTRDLVTAVREQLDRDGEHVRNLQGQADRQAEQVQAHREQLDRDGVHLRHLQDEVERLGARASEAVLAQQRLHDLQGQAERAGEHLRHLQDEMDRGVQDVRTVHQILARLEERSVNESVYIKGQLAQQGAVLQRWLSARKTGAREGSGVLAEEVAEFESHRLDAFYVSFENRFRGSREEIRNRIRFYLPFLHEARAGLEGRPIVDVGCGRGEWLELLREEGLAASGVDLNKEMVAQCVERNLSVTAGDAVAYLRSRPANSCGAVTGFHIIEHLPLETLIDLFAEAQRVLHPGGLAIFESPNCKNLMVGACNFNIDPTHRNPVFPETAEFILGTQGFENVQIEYLSPVDTSHVKGSGELPELLQGLLYGPQDFAVIARKPLQG